MSKSVKILSILMISLMLVTIVTPVFAANAGDVINSINAKQPNQWAQNSTLEVAGKVIGLIRWVAIVAGVIIITVFGLKYMMGSLEEKADYKKSFIPLIVGIVVVMSSTVIASIIISTFSAGNI